MRVVTRVLSAAPAACGRAVASAPRDPLARLAAGRAPVASAAPCPSARRGPAAARARTSVAREEMRADEASTSSPAAWWRGRNVVDVLRERGLVNQVTAEDDLRAAASSRRLRAYCGFDPTADSLHLGNLLGIIVLSWFQRCGHEPVALVGGATARVGDPSGRSTERPVLTEEQVEANTRGIREVLTRILGRTTPGAAAAPCTVMNNLEWFGPMGFLEFLRDVGKFARVGTMLAKDSVRTRLESEAGISFTEFTYQLLQGYDFVKLHRDHGVDVQVGGSDQWGNITAGTELLRKMSGDGAEANAGADGEGAAPSVFGLTFPLLLDASGNKFGKSTGGAIWLSPDKLSPYQFYQYLFKTEDADVVKFLRMLTFLPMEEIDALEASMGAPDYAPNTAQRRLAEEVTRFVHGEEGLEQAVRATEAMRPGQDTRLDAAALEAIARDVPSTSLPRDQVVGRPVVDVVVAAGLQPSKGAVRRLVQNGGLRVNNQQVQEADAVLQEADVIEGRLVLLAAGKKNKLLLRVD